MGKLNYEKFRPPQFPNYRVSPFIETPLIEYLVYTNYVSPISVSEIYITKLQLLSVCLFVCPLLG